MRTLICLVVLILPVSGCLGGDRGSEGPDDPIGPVLSEPPAEEPEPMVMPPETPPMMDEVDPADPCMGIDYLGSCDGAMAVWCDEDELRTRDCAAEGDECAWVDDSTGYYCQPSTDPIPPTAGCGNAIEMEQLAETNVARREFGLTELVCDDALTRAARLHSQDMCELGYFEHDSADGRTFADRIRAQGVMYRTAGENIAWGQPTPAAVHEAWMDSPGHRANILNGDFGRIGIGFFDCGGRPYWTQDFTN